MHMLLRKSARVHRPEDAQKLEAWAVGIRFRNDEQNHRRQELAHTLENTHTQRKNRMAQCVCCHAQPLLYHLFSFYMIQVYRGSGLGSPPPPP
jgi:hypothetical protein